MKCQLGPEVGGWGEGGGGFPLQAHTNGILLHVAFQQLQVLCNEVKTAEYSAKPHEVQI